MATNQSLKSNIQKKQNSAPAQQQGTTMKGLLSSPAVMNRFEEVLGKRASQFTASILSLYNGEKMLQKAEPMSVISSAMVAATLDLPVDKNLGYAWIVPYGGRAQFQLGYKGYIQLALRTGQYKFINCIPVHEGELQKWNPLTEEIEIDFEKRESDVVIGYAAYFELLNGFRKTVYWTKAQVEKHKKKFSKSDFGWKNDWDAMALKTVLKAILSKWGILSVEMQKAVIEDDEARERIDITDEMSEPEIIDAEVSEEKPSAQDADPFDGKPVDISDDDLPFD
ncbi:MULTISPECIES: recombinase RecT [Bacillus]|uniref:recombinase RecT n=1 Tax=Bacillus TaxID=1386 RepID=UPI000A08A4C5|nr:MULTISPECIES: recombinase RecT [Bacillus subtilis group]KAF1341677.1 putative DNA recombination protein skin element [Bacillus subtilis]MED3672048.1 recombinase RecT [Bacillus subtilis]MED4458351.1 recombinase RecT [Bacillus subtilis]MED4627356.1 recombinase RecT [Bacillus velezensis]PJN82416.1 recombinase RecT [Bacillus velezensis]